MSDINITNSQVNMQIDNEQNSVSNTQAQKEKSHPLMKKDEVEISNGYNKSKKVKQIAKKVDINTNPSNIGIETISDDIVNFVKNIFENYKSSNIGKEDATTLHTFYVMAKNSIAAAYGNATSSIDDLPSEVSVLSEQTFSRSLEKLDNWFQTQVQPDFQKVENTDPKNLKTEKTNNFQNRLLEVSKKIQQTISDIMKKQEISAKENLLQKPNYDFKG
ncbi:MAG: hypothetical protein ACQERZ_04820 [Fusobacteriota bacterium]